MNQKKIAVIGSGPAGITVAYELAKANFHVEVYEAGPRVGGLAKGIDLWGQRVDLGPHRFFSNNSRVNKIWLEVAGKDYRIVDRLTRIYYKNKLYHYPIKAGDALLKMGVFNAAACFLSYVNQKIFPVKQDGSFENWVVNRFGRKLFEIFFKTYSEKLWGISCKELDADFAAQRIKNFSLWEAVKNFLPGSDKKAHKTLVDQFAYPTGGTGMIYERMHDYIIKHNGNVYLNTPVKRVITENSEVKAIELVNGEVKEFDHVVSTMPLSLLVTRLPETPPKIIELANVLKFRNTILVYLHFEAKDLFKDNWLYIHNSDLKMGRITNFRNWAPEILNNKETTIVALEYWCYDDDEDWKKGEEDWIALAKVELRKTGLIGDAVISDGYVYKIHRCYPVYYRDYKKNLIPIQEYLTTIKGLSVIGRYGAFKYNNQDHSILMGLLAAENLIKGTDHDLWNINTDYEDYQEQSFISASGLVIKQ
jgi:protoporphyrinogen oxidase